MPTIAEALTTALDLHRTGNLQSAEAIYRQILQADPANPQAIHFLGLIAHQVGRHDIAVDYMRRSIALLPHNEGFYCNLGNAYQALGQLPDAAACFREALRLRPDRVELHFVLGNLCKMQGNSDDAAACYRQALNLKPDFGPAHNNLGNLLLEQNKVEEAAHHYQRALALNPGNASAHCNLGNALRRLGRLDEALASLHQALHLQPAHAEAHFNLAGVFQAQGRLAEAVASYREALRLVPTSVQALNNLGNTWGLLGNWQEAVGCYREALRLQPDCAEAHFNLGGALAMQRQLEEAAACFQQALRLQPSMADAHLALGTLLSDQQGVADEAIVHLEQAQRLQPRDRTRVLLATRLPGIYQSMADLESWRSRLIREIRQLRQEQVVLDLTDEPAPHLFYLAYQGQNDLHIMREAAGLYRAPAAAQLPTLQPRPQGTGKIAIGIISSFFKVHTIGQWMRGLVAQLSRDQFTVTVLSIGNHDDYVADHFKQHADRYVEIPTHLPSARRLIAGQGLDVLLYADIGMDPITYTLAFSRLAPVQCVTLGHPVTSGIDTIDYFISTEDLETGESEQHYTEKLIRLKNLPIYFYRPQLPHPLQGREHFGLAPGDHVYACLQSPFKFHPEFDELLGGILGGDPRGVLVLTQSLVPRWEELLRRRFATTLADVQHRIRFFPMQSYNDYLNLLALADVQLDTLHFGGGSTSLDGFAVGMPIVTMPTGLLRGRITYALYKQMGILDCVVANRQEYVSLALRLGTEVAFRAMMSNKILAASAALYENNVGIRDLEQFLVKVRSLW